MTSASEQIPDAPRDADRSKPDATHATNRPVLLAAILGGLLGAVFSFALARTFPAVPKPPPPGPPSEAHQFADDIFGKLKNGKNDEFKRLVRPAFAQMLDDQFDQFCQQSVFAYRDSFAKAHGGPSEFEFGRETVLSPSLVRVTYVEKYTRACILWVVMLYNTPDGWQVSAFSYDTATTGFTKFQ